MARKSKEKEISPEEALEMARKELAPFWEGLPPLFAGVRTPAGSQVFPIDQKFAELNCLLALIDVTQASSVAGLAEVMEFHRRFALHGLPVLLCLRAVYPYHREAGVLEVMTKKNHWPFNSCFDPDGAVFEAFGADPLPKVVLLEKGKVLAQAGGPGWFAEIEPHVHAFLRKLDPGLALYPYHVSPHARILDAGGIEFGESMPAEVIAQGNWVVDGQRRVTEDPQATLRFKLKAKGMSIVAQCMDRAWLPGDVIIEVSGKPIRDSQKGVDIERNEAGASCISVDHPRAYRVLENCNESKAEILLRFPHAHRVKIAVYGARFSNPG